LNDRDEVSGAVAEVAAVPRPRSSTVRTTSATTGRLGRHVDRVAIDGVGFLPSDVELVRGALLIAQTEPVPAIRRLACGSGMRWWVASLRPGLGSRSSSRNRALQRADS
jgi:hypothetical protein